MEFKCDKCGCTEYYESHESGRIRRRCKKCQMERMRAIYATAHYKEKHRDDDRRRRRGWTPELYQHVKESQRGLCAICGKILNDNLRADHDHATGKPRGLLCDNCNWGLGNFQDNIQYLKNAINYLEKYEDADHNPGRKEQSMDERIRRDMDEIKALAERHNLSYKEWEDERGWMCQIGQTGDVLSTIYWYTIDLEDTVLFSHRGTTQGCFWTEWKPLE